MWEWIKRIFVFLVVGFFLFLIIARPQQAAMIVNQIFAGISVVFNNLIEFFQHLGPG